MASICVSVVSVLLLVMVIDACTAASPLSPIREQACIHDHDHDLLAYLTYLHCIDCTYTYTYVHMYLAAHSTSCSSERAAHIMPRM